MLKELYVNESIRRWNLMIHGLIRIDALRSYFFFGFIVPEFPGLYNALLASWLYFFDFCFLRVLSHESAAD